MDLLIDSVPNHFVAPALDLLIESVPNLLDGTAASGS